MLSIFNQSKQFFKDLTLEKFSFFVFASTIFLIPIFFVPSQSFSLQFSKSALLYTGVILSFVLYLISVLREGKLLIPKNLFFLSVLLMPVIFFIASFRFVGVKDLLILPNSLLGYGFEPGTFAFLFLMLVLVYNSIALLKNKSRILKIYSLIAVSVLITIVYHIIRIFVFKVFGGQAFLSFGIFPNPISGFIGGWNDTGAFLAIGLLLSLSALEFLSLSRVLKIFSYIIFFASLLFLLIINFSVIWVILGILSILFLVYQFSFQKLIPKYSDSQVGELEDQADTRPFQIKKRVSKSILAVIIIALFITVVAKLPLVSELTGGDLGGLIAKSLNISNTEVRPSWQATYEIAKNTLRLDPILGSGPNHFLEEWLAYKPYAINSTTFWNTDFNYGIGLIPTFVITTGLIGGAVFVFFFFTVLFAGYKLIIKPIPNQFSRFIAFSSLLISLFLWILAIFYVPNLVLLSFAFLFSGIFASSLIQEKIIKLSTVYFLKNPRTSFSVSLILIVIAVGGFSLGYVMFQKAVSSYFFQKSVYSYKVLGDLDRAEKEITKAINLNDTDIYRRAYSEIELFRLRRIVASNDSSPENLNKFQNYLLSAVDNANRARSMNDLSYQNWIALGQVYEVLVPLGITDVNAYENAKASYEEAFKRNSKNPMLLVLLARLEVANRDFNKAKEYIYQALEMKADYTDAVFLLSQIQVSEGKTSEAVASVRAAISVSPNEPTLYFQLGLLQYNAKNYNAAISAFESAVSLVSEYSNARYFLGLSYYRAGKRSNAIEQFEKIQVLNPNNQEVLLILSNLKDGKSPFADAEPPADEPEKRSSPPIEED